jgi:cytochrome c556
MKYVLRSLLCSLLLVFSAFSLFGQDDAEFLIYKQKLMQSNGMHAGLIGQIMQKQLPFNAHVSSHAKIIQLNVLLLPDTFRKKIIAGKTDSKPDVWDKWDQFVAAANKSAQAAAALAAASEGDAGAKMRELGATCGGCHQIFRKPKNEQFVR